MPLTAKQERFAQLVASGETQSAAYRVAYPRSQAWQARTVWRKASLLAKNGEVMARLASLRRPQLDALAVTYEERIQRYRELSLLAQQRGNYSLAVRAEDRITRIAGLFKNKHPNEHQPFSDLTVRERDELRAVLEKAIEQARLQDSEQ